MRFAHQLFSMIKKDFHAVRAAKGDANVADGHPDEPDSVGDFSFACKTQ